MQKNSGTDSDTLRAQDPQNIRIADYGYELPDERIAKFPLQDRDLSKLLVFDSRNIQSDVFANLPNYLPSGSCLVFNNSKVIQARLVFQSPTGAEIEVFCLEPVVESMGQSQGYAEWKCFVGNAKRWKVESLFKTGDYEGTPIELKVSKVLSKEDYFIVRFEWQPTELTFDDILGILGFLPLPPYLNREATEEDKNRYQTIYAQFAGSVAAPTAGLHFTDRVLGELSNNSIESLYVTLHVGAGTFKPVKSETMEGHAMHDERVVVSKGMIKHLMRYLGNVTAVGTTSIRSLESLFWLGGAISNRMDQDPRKLFVDQWEPYRWEGQTLLSPMESMEVLFTFMEKNGLDELSFRTQILIVPGYTFQMVDRLITNFHQPESTLILLVAAFIGQHWKNVYQFALDNEYRFLSYGDSSLLFKC